MPKLVAAGDSFIYGNELDSQDSTFSAIIAKELNYTYKCIASGGASNNEISRKVIEYAQNNSDIFMLVGWTYPHRFEIKANEVIRTGESFLEDEWFPLCPYTLDKDNPAREKIRQNKLDKLAEILFTNVDEEWLIYDSYKSILLTQLFLKLKQIPYRFVLLTDRISYTKNVFLNSITDSKLVNDLIKNLDTDKFLMFEGHGFIDWVHKNNYSLKEGGHPGEKAHKDAANLILSSFFNK